MHKIIVSKDADGNWRIVNDDGAGIAGRVMGETHQEIQGGVVIIMDANKSGYLAKKTINDETALLILNDDQVRGIKLEMRDANLI